MALEDMIADSLEGNESLDESVVLDGDDDVAEGDEESVIEEGDGGEAIVEETETPEETEQPAEGEAAKVQEEVDEIAAALGIKPGKRTHPKEIERKARKYIAEQQAKYQTEITAREQRLAALAQYEGPEFREQQEALALAESNPEAFLSALIQSDSRYAELIQRAITAQQAPQAPNSADINIGPDVMLPDGSLGWSPEAMQRMMDARAAQAAQAAEQRINQQLEQRYGPIEARYRQEQMMHGALSKVQSALEQARSWVGFNENETDIKQELLADRKLTLEQAYIKVVSPKLAASRDQIRQQVLAEMGKKPRAAAASIAPGTGAGNVGKVSHPSGSIQALIQKSLDEL